MLNVHLRISDATTSRPTPVRLRLSSPDGTEFPPLGCAAEFPGGRAEDVGGRVRLNREHWWYIDGQCEIPLPAGVRLRIQATKGPEYTPLDETFTLGTGQLTLRFALSRWTDSHVNGWRSVDTRCHFITPHAALLESQAEGLDVVNLLAVPFPMLALDANTYITTPNLLAFSGQVPALNRDSCCVVVNTLNTHPALGKVALLHSHRPIFPLTSGGEQSDDWSICDWCDQCHRKKGLVVWVDAFESAAGVNGGEALVAAVLGKIDAIEMTNRPRKVPLLPWVYRLWDAGVLLPLVGASGKDSNCHTLGSMRTYAQTQSQSWVEAIRTGQTFITTGPLLTLTNHANRFRASATAHNKPSPVEIVANGQVVAAGDGEAEAVIAEPGWVAARSLANSGFAHTSPIRIGTTTRHPPAVAALRKLLEQTREWIETRGQFENPKRKQTMLERCAAAAGTLDGTT